MSTSRRPIFRENAIQHYIQGRNESVLPHFVAPPTFVFLWLLVGLGLIVSALGWSMQVPLTVAGTGLILNGGSSSQGRAIILLAPDQLHRVRPGQIVQLKIKDMSIALSQRVAVVEPDLLSPYEVRRRYHLDGSLSLIVTKPSVVAIVNLDQHIPTNVYQGSIMNATIQIGTQRVSDLLLNMGSFIKD